MSQTHMEITLPSSWYLDHDIFALEREHIFLQEWLCVGRQEEIINPGDHRVLNVQGESIILLRNGENQLRAFYNVCRHRGARLCADDDSGGSLLKGGVSSKFITCPYHAWSYDLDGQLVRARDIPEDYHKGVPHRPGAVTFTATGTTNRRTIPGLNDDEQTRHFGELVYPNLFLSLSSDHVAVFLLQADGPDRTQVDCHLLFEPCEMDRAEFNPADAADFWDLVNRQDWEICKRVQQGMASRVFEHGFCSPMEDLTLDIRKYVTERIRPYLQSHDQGA